MKAVILLTALFVASFATGSVAQNLEPQHAQQVSQTQRADVSTSMSFSATNAHVAPISMDAVKSITRSTVREQIAQGLDNVTPAEIGAHMSSSFQNLVAGNPISFGERIAGSSKAATSLHSISVKVSYDPRPIGGILNIRVALVPVFSGIGTASRPAAVREVAQAVDSFDQDTVNEIVANLSHELAAEYATN